MGKSSMRDADEVWWCIDMLDKDEFPKLTKVKVIALGTHYLMVDEHGGWCPASRKYFSKSYRHYRHKEDALKWLVTFYQDRADSWLKKYNVEMEKVRKRLRKEEEERWKAQTGTRSLKQALTEARSSKSQ